MKKSKISAVLLLSLAVTSLASCNTHNQSQSSDNSEQSSATPSSEPAGENYVVSNVDAKHEFVLFDANRSKDCCSLIFQILIENYIID